MAPDAALEARARSAWRQTFFANVAPHDRARSGTDALDLLVATGLLVIAIGLFRNDPRFEAWLVEVAIPPPQGLAWILSAMFFAGTFGATGLLAAFAVIRRDRALTIDLAGAFAIGFALSIGMQLLLGTTAGRVADPALAEVNVGFPVPILSAVIAACIAGRPYLAQGVRRFVGLALALAVFGSIFTGRALPLALVGSFLVGWMSACVIRLITGRPRVIADPVELRTAIAEMGLELAGAEVRRATREATFGVDRIVATTPDGELSVSVYGRDSRDAEILRSIWRWITVRDHRAAPFVSRQQQAEHEALVTAALNIASSGASPRLVGMAATRTARDVMVVSRPAASTPLREFVGEPVDDEVLSGVADLVARCHRGRIAVGAVDLDRLGVLDGGRAVVIDPSEAVVNPAASDFARDVASTMTVLALLAGVERSVRVSLASFGSAEVSAALPYLQRAAFTASLSADAKRAGTLLADLQGDAARALSVESVELVPLRRVSGATLVIAIGTLIGGWALIGVLVNVAASISTIRGADLAWVAVTFIVAQLVFPALAMTDLGSVTGPLPFGRVVVLEVSNTFSGLAAGTVAVMAARVRFFQRQGYDATVAVSSGVLVSMVSWMVKTGLFLIALPFVWSSVHITLEPEGSTSNGHLAQLILVAIVAIGVALAAVLFVPRWRRIVADKLRPKYDEVRGHLRELSARPVKLVEIFGGNTLAQLVIAASLGASLHAFDVSLPMSALLFVLTLGSVVGGIAPVPGGMGVVEAGMIIALTWVGVPQDEAVAAVFVQRLFTAYLPPIWGYGALLWLRRREYL